MDETQPTLAQRLERWREAERRRDALDRGTVEHYAALGECERLATEYRLAFEAAVAVPDSSEAKPASG